MKVDVLCPLLYNGIYTFGTFRIVIAFINLSST